MGIQNSYTTGKFISLFAVLVLQVSTTLFAQTRKLDYCIISKKDTVGYMQIQQETAGDDVSLSASSQVNTKVLMPIKVNVKEEVNYLKGKMTSSVCQRYINNKLKADKTTKASGEYYVLTDDKKQSRLNVKAVTYDFTKLYFSEPVNIKEVYSNFHQRYLPIRPLENHTYRITMPDGGVNTYYYTGKICSQVDISSSLFNAQMILNR